MVRSYLTNYLSYATVLNAEIFVCGLAFFIIMKWNLQRLKSHLILPKPINCQFSSCFKMFRSSKLIWQIHLLFKRYFQRVSSVHFQTILMKKLRYKYYNKRITTRDNGNVQSHDQEESKLNSTINANSGAHTLTHDKIIESLFYKNNVATIKSK